LLPPFNRQSIDKLFLQKHFVHDHETCNAPKLLLPVPLEDWEFGSYTVHTAFYTLTPLNKMFIKVIYTW